LNADLKAKYGDVMKGALGLMQQIRQKRKKEKAFTNASVGCGVYHFQHWQDKPARSRRLHYDQTRNLYPRICFELGLYLPQVGLAW